MPVACSCWETKIIICKPATGTEPEVRARIVARRHVRLEWVPLLDLRLLAVAMGAAC